MIDAGRIEGGVHRILMRVYYEDTDAGGIVYHANHLRFAERARTEMMRCLGFDHVALKEHFGVLFAVRRCLADFFSPARLDDVLEVRTWLVRLRRASLDLVQEVARDDHRLVHLEIRLALVCERLRAARMPGELRRALEGLPSPSNRADVLRA